MDRQKPEKLDSSKAGRTSAEKSQPEPCLDTSYGICHSGICIKISDSLSGHTVVLSNFSNILRNIEAVQPFKVYAGSTPVDLTKLFKSGSLSIPALTVSTFFIPYVGETRLRSNRKMVMVQDDKFSKAERLQPVEVHSSLNGEENMQVRQHLARFS